MAFHTTGEAPSVPPQAVLCHVDDSLVHEQMEETGQSLG